MRQAWSFCAQSIVLRPTCCNSGDANSVRIKSKDGREVGEWTPVEKKGGLNATPMYDRRFYSTLSDRETARYSPATSMVSKGVSEAQNEVMFCSSNGETLLVLDVCCALEGNSPSPDPSHQRPVNVNSWSFFRS